MGFFTANFIEIWYIKENDIKRGDKMFSLVKSMGLDGIKGYSVGVECDIQDRALPGTDIVGLPDSAVKEARDRVKSAMKNSGFEYPPGKVTINLTPADIRKIGSLYDLPIALSLLQAIGYLDVDLPTSAFVGELSLSGEIRPVSGILPMAIAAEQRGLKAFFIPWENRTEASVLKKIAIYPVKSLRELYRHFSGAIAIEPIQYIPPKPENCSFNIDFSDVKGQEGAKRALEIAAAGGHNLIMVGSPGSGKSMLAKRIPTILPEMNFEESIESTELYSVAGLLTSEEPMIVRRPFRSPHHSISSVALSGGGTIPHPGELSLAHNGVLFLDELPEFSRSVLEVLRQPMEDQKITISRSRQTVTFPCSTMVVAAMNPCSCGYYGHPTRVCTCKENAVHKYVNRVSGPLLDRLDIHVEVAPVEFIELTGTKEAEKSADIRKRVDAARQIQMKRYENLPIHCNARLRPQDLEMYCTMEKDASVLLQQAFDRMGLSARAYDKIVKIARTIADLEGVETLKKEHVAEAVQYRSLDRKYWNG